MTLLTPTTMKADSATTPRLLASFVWVPLLLFALFVIPVAGAQAPGNCQQGIAENDLNLSDVFARVFNTGSLFFGNTTTVVPSP